MELELVLLEELLKSGCELAAEDAAECTDGQEEWVGRSDPSGAIGSKAASGNDVMYVGMMLKVLTPGMKHEETRYLLPGASGLEQVRGVSLH